MVSRWPSWVAKSISSSRSWHKLTFLCWRALKHQTNKQNKQTIIQLSSTWYVLQIKLKLFCFNIISESQVWEWNVKSSCVCLFHWQMSLSSTFKCLFCSELCISRYEISAQSVRFKLNEVAALAEFSLGNSFLLPEFLTWYLFPASVSFHCDRFFQILFFL